MDIKEYIASYQPLGEQEETDQKTLLDLLDTYDNLLTRDNPVAHFTCSSWIVNPKRDKVLMIYHKIYQSWSWTGGHADGDDDFIHVALKEAKEETGVDVQLVDEKLFALDILHVAPHIKRGKYVGAHLHLNVTYLCEADENAMLVLNQEETNGVKWINIDEIDQYVSLQDIAMLQVYHKLNERIK